MDRHGGCLARHVGRSTMTQSSVSEELVLEACDVFLLNYDPPLTAQMRAVLNAIAPRLKAEGMREAVAMMVDDTGDYSDTWLAGAILVAADALDPPPQQGPKP